MSLTRKGIGFYNCGCKACVLYFGTEQNPTKNWIPISLFWKIVRWFVK